MTFPRRTLLPAFLALLAGPGCNLFRRPVEVSAPPVRHEDDGLVYWDIDPGEGRRAAAGDVVRLHYYATLPDGTAFDSSYERGLPVEIEIGAGQVVPGWEEGLVGMRAGGRRHLEIPPELAYGDEGLEGVVPPGSSILLEVEVLEIRHPSAPSNAESARSQPSGP